MSVAVRNMSTHTKTNGYHTNNQKIMSNGGTSKTNVHHHHPGRTSPKQGNGDMSSINLKTVERIDEGAREILKTVSCVVIYEYLEKSESWERTSMEGTLFIYSRDDGVSPGSSYALLILSKLTNENLLVHLHNSMVVHTNCPFVLFKKSEKDKIYGINFKKESTCTEVGKELQRLSRISRPLSSDNPKLTIQGRNNLTPSPTSSDGGDNHEEAGSVSHDSHVINNIQQRKEHGRRLRQANNNRRTSEPIIITHSKPRGKRESSPLYSSGSSFSKASGRSNGQSPSVVGHTHSHVTPIKSGTSTSKDKVNGDHAPLPMDSSSNLVKKLFHSSTVEEPPQDTPPVLNHIFASIASSQVTATPSTGSNSTPPKRMVSVSELEHHITNNEGEVPLLPVSMIGSGSPVPSNHRLLHPSAFSSLMSENVNGQSTNETDSHSKPEVNVCPPTPGTGPLSSFPAIPLLVQSPGMRSHPVATATDHTSSSTSQSTSESSDTISTLPTMEAPPTTVETSSTSSSALMSPQVFQGVNRSSSEPTKFKSGSTTIGLTEQQLQQALVHLIKNDASFLTTLHKAYVESLQSSTR